MKPFIVECNHWTLFHNMHRLDKFANYFYCFFVVFFIQNYLAVNLALYYLKSGEYLRKIASMASTKIAFYIYYLLIISPGIHVYVYYMVFAKLLQENYLKNLFQDVPIWEHQALKPLSGTQGTCPTCHTLDTPLDPPSYAQK